MVTENTYPNPNEKNSLFLLHCELFNTDNLWRPELTVPPTLDTVTSIDRLSSDRTAVRSSPQAPPMLECEAVSHSSFPLKYFTVLPRRIRRIFLVKNSTAVRK